MLDQDDLENLHFILKQMYPDIKEFENKEPTTRTMEIYLRALKGNLFCHQAMTELTTGLVAGPGGYLYRGAMKRLVKKILKKVRDQYREKGLNFYICNQAVKLKYRSSLTLSLKGNPGA